jgi:hypothetical protein
MQLMKRKISNLIVGLMRNVLLVLAALLFAFDGRALSEGLVIENNSSQIVLVEVLPHPNPVDLCKTGHEWVHPHTTGRNDLGLCTIKSVTVKYETGSLSCVLKVGGQTVSPTSVYPPNPGPRGGMGGISWYNITGQNVFNWETVTCSD